MSEDAASKRVRLLARLLDSKYKLGPLRIGWDAILGLFPGIGDSIASIGSSFIVYEALSRNMSKATIIRMVVNILIDTLLGSIPVIGDFVDIFWKSNQLNAKLYLREVERPKPAAKLSALWLFGIGLILLCALILSVYIPIKLIVLVIQS